MTLITNKLARHFHSGFLREFREYHPNELGNYYAVQYFQKKGLKVYNMGSAGKAPKRGEFKIGWGKLITIYYCQFHNSKILTMAVRNFNKTRSWLRNHHPR